jgi:hypothetical protein
VLEEEEVVVEQMLPMQGLEVEREESLLNFFLQEHILILLGAQGQVVEVVQQVAQEVKQLLIL